MSGKSMILNLVRGIFSPRMIIWAIISVLLVAAALFVQSLWPTSLVAVTLYKAHLMSLGGWGGYWLDRFLFPYDRPHSCLEGIECEAHSDPDDPNSAMVAGIAFGGSDYSVSMLRRAIVVVGCLICVGLGA